MTGHWRITGTGFSLLSRRLALDGRSTCPKLIPADSNLILAVMVLGQESSFVIVRVVIMPCCPFIMAN